MSQRIASGHGLATISLSGAVLDTWFPEPMLGNLSNPVLPFLSALAGVDEIRGVKREVVSLEIDLDKAPESVSDAYLRLHLLSHRVIKPHGANVDGIFAILNNVVWTSVGPCPVENFEITRAKLKQKYGAITVLAVDKFPRMLITLFHQEYALPMPIEFDSVLTYLQAQLLCMKDLLISMPEPLERQWLKDAYQLE